MAFNLTYTITAGVVPVTVELLSSGKLPNVHISVPSQDSFTDVADGTYTLRITDSQGCIEETPITYPPTTTSTSTIYVSTTTTTTSLVPTTTTTTTSDILGVYLAEMPGGMSQHGFDTYNGKLYAFGGDSSKQVYEYNPVSNSWTTKTAIPTAASQRQSMGVRTVGSKIYLISGMDGSTISAVTGEVLEYDPALDSYTTKTSKPTPVEDFGTAVIGTKIYCFGGLKNVAGAAVPTNVLEIYDTVANTWDTTKASMPAAKVLGDFGAACNGKVYAIGSESAFSTYPILVPVAKMYEYDPIGDSWSEKADTPLLSCYREAEVIGDYIYIMSGAGAGTYQGAPGIANLNWECYRYDTVGDTWIRLLDVPYSSLGSALTLYNGKIYMCGGNNLGYGGTPHTKYLFRFDNINTPYPTTTTTSTIPPSTTTTTTSIYEGNLFLNLVSVWELDETSGFVSIDSYASNDGTITGSPINATGKIDKAYAFDGTNKTVVYPSGLTSDLPLTISVWINVPTSGRIEIGDIGNSQNNINNYFSLRYLQSTDQISFHYGDGTGSSSSDRRSWNVNSAGLSINTWYHIVVITQATVSTAPIIYLNGVAQTVSDGGGTATTMTHTAIYMNCANLAGTPLYFSGTIDQLSLWSRQLNLVDVLQLYNSNNGLAYTSWGTPPSTTTTTTTIPVSTTTTTTTLFPPSTTTTTTSAIPDLVTNLYAVWELDEASGTTAFDSFSTHDATNSNATVNQTGKLNKAYSFNGSSSELTTGITDQSYRTGDAFTISLWINHNFSATTGSDTIISKSNGNSTGTEFILRQNGTSTTTIQLFLRDGATNRTLIGTTTMNSGTWYHVVMMHTGSEIRLYVNGAQESNSPIATTSNMLNLANELIMGSYDGVTIVTWYNGLLDQVAIWNNTISQDQIDYIYNSGNGRPSSEWGFTTTTTTTTP